MEKEKKLDCRCIVSLGFRLCSRGQQRTGSRTLPRHCSHTEGGLGEDDTPFLQRFLLQEIIFAQPVQGCLSRSAAALGGSSAEQICSVYEELLPPNVRSSPLENSPPIPSAACEHPNSGTARRSLPAPVLLDESSWWPDQVPWYGSSGRAVSHCSGQTDSIYDSEADIGKWDLDAARNNCPRAPGPESQPAVPFQPREVLDSSDLEEVFQHRCPALQNCPHHVRVRFRQVAQHAVEARSHDRGGEARGWKLFCLLPVLFLRRSRDGG